MRVSGNEMESP